MNIRTAIIGLTTAAGLSTVALTGGQVHAEELNLIAATSHPPGLPWVGTIKDFVIPEIDKRFKAAGIDTEIRWNEQYGTGLFPPTEALESVESGIAHMTWVGTLFEPAKMSLLNVSFSAPFVTDNVMDQLTVMNAMYDKIPAMGQVWEAHNQVFLGAQATASYEILTKFPLRSFADLEGKKILAAGPMAQWLRNTGAVPVDGNLPAAFNMLQTGVVDGTIMPITNAFAFKLHEVAKYVTLVNIGSQTTGGLSISKSVFDGLPPEGQQIVRDVGREFSAVHGNIIVQRSQGALAKMKEAGAEITELAPAEKQKWLDALPPLGAEWVERNATNGPSREILVTFMTDMKARGNQPLRDWSQ
jgi:TRAP-type C4-dicarboxylate transport system substrate-binding protein